MRFSLNLVSRDARGSSSFHCAVYYHEICITVPLISVDILQGAKAYVWNRRIIRLE